MEWLSTSTTKNYRLGCARTRPPEETLLALEPFWARMGLTRLANITGLDTIGIPTALAVRPNAKSLSVSQGKGVTLAAAKVSALMESLELFHAEATLLELRLATAREMRNNEHIIDLNALPRSFRDPSPGMRCLWAPGTDLTTGAPIWVPFGLVTMDLTLPLLEGSEVYPPSSNGLASGNERNEALVHALCELIERDAYTRFFQRHADAKRALRVDLRSVQDMTCRALLEAYARADVLVEVWDMTSDVGVPAFLCAVLEAEANPFRHVGLAHGSGAHLDPAVALARALSEAAQSRLTRISGSRDDMLPENIQDLQRPSRRAEHLRYFDAEHGILAHRSNTGFSTTTFEDDVRYLIERLAACGLSQVVGVDLSRPGWPVSVVRTIVPGLEGMIGSPAYRPGRRALHAERQP
jgi:ribosomal protein S12 methylthiotransferase accessory factor